MKDIRIFLIVFAFIAFATFTGYVGYWLGSTQFLVKHNFLKAPIATVTPTETVTVTPELTTTVTPTLTPAKTTIPVTTTTVTAAPVVSAIKNLIVQAEEVTEGVGNGKTYARQYVYSSQSSTAHYLLEASKVANFPILSTISEPFGVYKISSDLGWSGAAAGNSYSELSANTTILLGTRYEGESGVNAYGDGKVYYEFLICSTKHSTCNRYLIEKSLITGANATLIKSLKVGDTVYLAGAVKSAGAAAGTSYYYITGSIALQK